MSFFTSKCLSSSFQTGLLCPWMTERPTSCCGSQREVLKWPGWLMTSHVQSWTDRRDMNMLPRYKMTIELSLLSNIMAFSSHANSPSLGKKSRLHTICTKYILLVYTWIKSGAEVVGDIVMSVRHAAIIAQFMLLQSTTQLLYKYYD